MDKTWRTTIGVMGAGACDGATAELAREVGRRIAGQGAVLLCGGLGGVMEAAAEGAREAGGLTLGVLPGRGARESPPNRHIDVALFTGMGDGRNYINACASDAIIAIAGEWGTLSEIALARKVGTPVVVLQSWELGRPDVAVARDAEQAVELAMAAVAKGGR